MHSFRGNFFRCVQVIGYTRYNDSRNTHVKLRLDYIGDVRSLWATWLLSYRMAICRRLFFYTVDSPSSTALKERGPIVSRVQSLPSRICFPPETSSAACFRIKLSRTLAAHTLIPRVSTLRCTCFFRCNEGLGREDVGRYTAGFTQNILLLLKYESATV